MSRDMIKVMGRTLRLTALLLAFCAVTQTSCQLLFPSSSGPASRRAAANSRAENSNKAKAPPAEKQIAVLRPSEVEISGGLDSAAGGAGLSSQVESQQVAASDARVEQILSEFNARQTDEGIVIDLPENILFDFDKSVLRPDAQTALEKINELLTHYRDAPVAIYGHTDGKGSDSYNQTLSEKRAAAVKDSLVKNFNVATDRLEAKGYGKSKPVAPNTNPDGSDNPEGRQKNRRVEVLIRKK